MSLFSIMNCGGRLLAGCALHARALQRDSPGAGFLSRSPSLGTETAAKANYWCTQRNQRSGEHFGNALQQQVNQRRDTPVCSPTGGFPAEVCHTTCGCRYIPEEALHRFGTPRPAALALTGLAAASASVMAAFAGLGALFPASSLAGLAFGEASAVASETSEHLRVCYSAPDWMSSFSFSKGC